MNRSIPIFVVSILLFVVAASAVEPVSIPTGGYIDIVYSSDSGRTGANDLLDSLQSSTRSGGFCVRDFSNTCSGYVNSEGKEVTLPAGSVPFTITLWSSDTLTDKISCLGALGYYIVQLPDEPEAAGGDKQYFFQDVSSGKSTGAFFKGAGLYTGCGSNAMLIAGNSPEALVKAAAEVGKRIKKGQQMDPGVRYYIDKKWANNIVIAFAEDQKAADVLITDYTDAGKSPIYILDGDDEGATYTDLAKVLMKVGKTKERRLGVDILNPDANGRVAVVTSADIGYNSYDKFEDSEDSTKSLAYQLFALLRDKGDEKLQMVEIYGCSKGGTPADLFKNTPPYLVQNAIVVEKNDEFRAGENGVACQFEGSAVGQCTAKVLSSEESSDEKCEKGKLGTFEGNILAYGVRTTIDAEQGGDLLFVSGLGSCATIERAKGGLDPRSTPIPTYGGDEIKKKGDGYACPSGEDKGVKENGYGIISKTYCASAQLAEDYDFEATLVNERQFLRGDFELPPAGGGNCANGAGMCVLFSGCIASNVIDANKEECPGKSFVCCSLACGPNGEGVCREEGSYDAAASTEVTETEPACSTLGTVLGKTYKCIKAGIEETDVVTSDSLFIKVGPTPSAIGSTDAYKCVENVDFTLNRNLKPGEGSAVKFEYQLISFNEAQWGTDAKVREEITAKDKSLEAGSATTQPLAPSTDPAIGPAAKVKSGYLVCGATYQYWLKLDGTTPLGDTQGAKEWTFDTPTSTQTVSNQVNTGVSGPQLSAVVEWTDWQGNIFTSIPKPGDTLNVASREFNVRTPFYLDGTDQKTATEARALYNNVNLAVPTPAPFTTSPGGQLEVTGKTTDGSQDLKSLIVKIEYVDMADSQPIAPGAAGECTRESAAQLIQQAINKRLLVLEDLSNRGYLKKYTGDPATYDITSEGADINAYPKQYYNEGNIYLDKAQKALNAIIYGAQSTDGLQTVCDDAQHAIDMYQKMLDAGMYETGDPDTGLITDAEDLLAKRQAFWDYINIVSSKAGDCDKWVLKDNDGKFTGKDYRGPGEVVTLCKRGYENLEQALITATGGGERTKLLHFQEYLRQVWAGYKTQAAVLDYHILNAWNGLTNWFDRVLAGLNAEDDFKTKVGSITLSGRLSLTGGGGLTLEEQEIHLDLLKQEMMEIKRNYEGAIEYVKQAETFFDSARDRNSVWLAEIGLEATGAPGRDVEAELKLLLSQAEALKTQLQSPPYEIDKFRLKWSEYVTATTVLPPLGALSVLSVEGRITELASVVYYDRANENLDSANNYYKEWKSFKPVDVSASAVTKAHQYWSAWKAENNAKDAADYFQRAILSYPRITYDELVAAEQSAEYLARLKGAASGARAELRSEFPMISQSLVGLDARQANIDAENAMGEARTAEQAGDQATAIVKYHNAQMAYENALEEALAFKALSAEEKKAKDKAAIDAAKASSDAKLSGKDASTDYTAILLTYGAMG